MYFGMSGMLWLEFCVLTEKEILPCGMHGRCLCFRLVLFSGCVELLQEYCTTYRGGDWLDFTANSLGAIFASLIGYYWIRPGC